MQNRNADARFLHIPPGAVVTQANGGRPPGSPEWFLLLFSGPDRLRGFLWPPLKSGRVYLPKKIRVYLIKLKRAIGLLILTGTSYLLVSSIYRAIWAVHERPQRVTRVRYGALETAHLEFYAQFQCADVRLGRLLWLQG